MENWPKDRPLQRIIRLPDVLRRTGFSRSTLYRLIGKKEFPHQISLTPCSIGWFEEEVDAWIAQRANTRPASGSQTWLLDGESSAQAPEDIRAQNGPVQKKLAENSPRTERSKLRKHLSTADLIELEPAGTNFYVDRSTGSLWIQVLCPKQSGPAR